MKISTFGGIFRLQLVGDLMDALNALRCYVREGKPELRLSLKYRRGRPSHHLGQSKAPFGHRVPYLAADAYLSEIRRFVKIVP